MAKKNVTIEIKLQVITDDEERLDEKVKEFVKKAVLRDRWENFISGYAVTDSPDIKIDVIKKSVKVNVCSGG